MNAETLALIAALSGGSSGGGGGGSVDAYTKAEADALLGNKADRVAGATANHLAALDASGNLKDSGKTISDIAALETETANLILQSILPTNRLISDASGNQEVFVERPSMKLSELLNTTDTSVHPAFLINGETKSSLFFGKYQASLVDGKAYSLPRRDPMVNISLDNTIAACRAKGTGHHCITAAEWAFLALLAKKRGTIPKGNNNYGKDVSENSYIAIPTTKESSGRANRVATGTGPLTWSDTNDLSGIYDLNGNVWEQISGIRLIKGELQVIPYNNAAHPDTDIGATSTEWRALAAAATSYADLFITPDGQGTTTGSIKLDYVSNHWQWGMTISNQSDSPRNASFAATTFDSGVSDFCKMYLQALAFAPDDGENNYGEDVFWANNGADETKAVRGGYWTVGAAYGVFALSLLDSRSAVGVNAGGRTALYDGHVPKLG